MADRVVDRGEAVEVDEDRPDPLRPDPLGAGRVVAVACQQVLGPLLQVGAVWQPGQAVVEGEVGDLPLQGDLVADVAGRDQEQLGPTRLRA